MALCFSIDVEQSDHPLLSISVVPSVRLFDISLGLIHKLFWSLLSLCHLILKLREEVYRSISLPVTTLSGVVELFLQLLSLLAPDRLA